MNRLKTIVSEDNSSIFRMESFKDGTIQNSLNEEVYRYFSYRRVLEVSVSKAGLKKLRELYPEGSDVILPLPDTSKFEFEPRLVEFKGINTIKRVNCSCERDRLHISKKDGWYLLTMDDENQIYYLQIKSK